MFKPPYLQDDEEEAITPSDARTAKRDKNRVGEHSKRQHQSSSNSQSKESSSHQVGVLKKFLPPYQMSDDEPEP